METIILNPFEANAYGVIEYYIKSNKLVVDYNINYPNAKEICRLAAMSSRRPNNCAVNIDVPDFTHSMASNKVEISETGVAYHGYTLGDIDTFALYFANNNEVKILCAGFKSLYWDISYPIGRICVETNNEVTHKAMKLLDGVKKPCHGNNEYLQALNQLALCMAKLHAFEGGPLREYSWYKAEQISDLPPFGACRHLTETDNFVKAYQNSRVLLAGVKENKHLALALKGSEANPFDNAEDCAVKAGDFWVVGILFEKDGQYFEKLQ